MALDPDPFDAECPDPGEISDIELIDLLEVASKCPKIFTDWEVDFCDSIADQLDRGKVLSEAQLEVLRRGLLKRLWDNDPELWR